MPETTPLSREQIVANFADLHPALARGEALVEAARCLFCYDAPCQRACPTGIDVPRFITQILHEDTAGAARTILDENILGGSCARACPTEVLCEGACVVNALHGSPVQIGRLQRHATDFASERGLRFFEPGPPTRRRVAIVGSGPAGLSCAFHLRRLGHDATIFETRDVPGGLNTFGIAAYKISTEFALTEVARVRELGVDIRVGEHVDGARLADLRSQFDAVFIAVGLGATARLELPGEDLPGVWEALDFVFQLHAKPLHECAVGRRVVVIGGGNTAIDVAVQARRLGAALVTIAYRRSEAEMSAFAHEVDLARRQDVLFEWNVAPVAFLEENGEVSGVRFERIAGPGAGTALDLHCNQVILALGQTPVLDLVSGLDGLRFDRGRLVVHDTRTGISDLFAGGDCVRRGGEIVDAVQDGKVAAREIDRYLSTPTSVSP